MGLVVVVKLDRRSYFYNQWNIRSIGCCIQTIIFVPASIQSRLVARSFFITVIARLDLKRTLPYIIFFIICKQGVFTCGLPISRAAQLVLMRTGNVDRVRIGGGLGLGNGNKNG